MASTRSGGRLGSTSEALAAVLRPGNAGSNTAADHIAVLDLALAQLPVRPKRIDAVNGVAMLARADSAGATHGFLDALRERGIEFSVGLDITEPVRLAILRRRDQGLGRGHPPGHDVREVPRSPRSPSCWTCRRGRRGRGRSWAGRSPGGNTEIPPRRPAQPCSTPRDGATRSSSPTRPMPTSPTWRPATGAMPGLRTASAMPSQGHRAAQPALRWLRLQCRLGRAGAHGRRICSTFTQGLVLGGELATAERRRLRYMILHMAGRITRGSRQVTLRLQHSWRWAAELANALARLRALPLLS